MTDRNILETFESIMGHAHEAAADAVELAYDAGKQEERKRIVAWLREVWSEQIGDLECEATAHAIEAGEYRND
jgi:hypothetical protein